MYNEILQKIKTEMLPIDDTNYGGMEADIYHVFESDEGKAVTAKMGKNNETCVVEIECKNDYDSLQSLYEEAKTVWDFIQYHCFQMSTVKYYGDWVVLDGITILENFYYFHCVVKLKCPNYKELTEIYQSKWGPGLYNGKLYDSR